MYLVVFSQEYIALKVMAQVRIYQKEDFLSPRVLMAGRKIEQQGVLSVVAKKLEIELNIFSFVLTKKKQDCKVL